MTRIYSDMTASQFMTWCDRHRVNCANIKHVLGVSPSSYSRYCHGEPITETVAKLCRALDLIHEYCACVALTPHDLARICANPATARRALPEYVLTQSPV